MSVLPASSPPRPQLHGHRGCRGLFPENTLPAFLHALLLGVDVLEMDVVISADNQVVVAHEPWLPAHLGWSPDGQPISPSHEREYNIYHLPYALVRQCQVGMVPYPVFPQQQQVPTYRPLLREVVQVVEAACAQLGRPPVAYSIEVKSTPATDGIFHPRPAEFVELVLRACAPSILVRTTLLSFDPRILQVARQLLPGLTLCLLIEAPFSVGTVFQELGFVPEAFGPDYRLLNQEVVREIGIQYPLLRVVCWTVNNTADLLAVAKWGVAGITTDYPEKAQLVLNTVV